MLEVEVKVDRQFYNKKLFAIHKETTRTHAQNELLFWS
jgi:hypothetical protein